MKRFRTIRWRIAAWTAGFTLAAQTLLAGYFYYRLIRSVDYQLDRFIDEESSEVQHLLHESDTEAIRELLAESPMHDKAYVWFSIRDESGKILFLSSSRKETDLLLTEALREALRSASRVRTRVDIQGMPARMRTMKVTCPDGRVRFVQVAVSEREAIAAQSSYVTQVSLAVIPCVALALASGFIVARRATAPIDDIAAAASRIQGRNLGERIPLRGTGDELDQLSTVLNTTFASLEQQFLRVRDFSASASHQLKTPLTVIRGEADLLLRERPHDPDAARFATIAEEAAHLARIVDQLLFLARADAEKLDEHFEPVDLAGVVERGIRRIEPYITVKGLKLDSGLKGTGVVMGSEPLLATAVQNLLDNAAKYSPEGGRMRVRIESRDGLVRVDVDNDGAEIGKDRRDRLMERFAASEPGPGHGAGLGLAVAKEIALLHKGQLIAADPPGDMGVRFRLELPAAATS